VWPAVDRFDMKPVIHVTNMLQNVILWALPYWATCVSICAHFLILGQIIIVIELWARRRDLLPGTDESSTSSMSSQKSSSSSSSHTPSGDDYKDEGSEQTIEYESKRPPEQTAKGSDVESDDEAIPGGQGTFVF
jgi:hypothetical protein